MLTPLESLEHVAYFVIVVHEARMLMLACDKRVTRHAQKIHVAKVCIDFKTSSSETIPKGCKMNCGIPYHVFTCCSAIQARAFSQCWEATISSIIVSVISVLFAELSGLSLSPFQPTNQPANQRSSLPTAPHTRTRARTHIRTPPSPPLILLPPPPPNSTHPLEILWCFGSGTGYIEGSSSSCPPSS